MVYNSLGLSFLYSKKHYGIVMELLKKVFELIAIIDVAVMVVYNFFAYYGSDKADFEQHRKRIIITNILFLVILLLTIMLSKAMS